MNPLKYSRASYVQHQFCILRGLICPSFVPAAIVDRRTAFQPNTWPTQVVAELVNHPCRPSRNPSRSTMRYSMKSFRMHLFRYSWTSGRSGVGRVALLLLKSHEPLLTWR